MFLDIVALSLAVSLSASVAAAGIGLPLGAALAMFEFRGRSLLILIANALFGLPPVVVGLALYLLLSRPDRSAAWECCSRLQQWPLRSSYLPCRS